MLPKLGCYWSIIAPYTIACLLNLNSQGHAWFHADDATSSCSLNLKPQNRAWSNVDPDTIS